MATYFTSDQHICMRYPERGRRFARFIELINPSTDHLVIAGDLCDFWFTTREAKRPVSTTEPGLKTLKSFINSGGNVTLLAGNHDQHLQWYYRDTLGLDFCKEPTCSTIEGRQVHLAHGHLLGGRSRWKGWMESQSFLKVFEQVPDPIANSLASQLKKYNSRNKKVDNLRHYLVFQNYVQNLTEPATDLVVLGHVHQTILREIPTPESILSSSPEVPQTRTLAVLGHWFHQSSWLRLENGQTSFYIWSDNEKKPEQVNDSRIAGPAHN